MTDYDFSQFAGKASAAIGGLTTIGSNYQQASKPKVINGWEANLPMASRLGSQGYGSLGQIESDYGFLENISAGMPTQQEIRGMSSNEKGLNVLSSTATGALTGLQVGGPGGALAGGVVGLGAGLGGVFQGDEVAKQRNLNNMGLLADTMERGARSINYSADNYLDYLSDQKASRVLARGGKIHKQRAIQEFADRIMNNRTVNEHSRSAGIVRQKVDGGVKIRIKR